MGARYYDPELARFTSADTIVPDPFSSQALNRYSYVYNNPLSYTDPSGHTPEGTTGPDPAGPAPVQQANPVQPQDFDDDIPGRKYTFTPAVVIGDETPSVDGTGEGTSTTSASTPHQAGSTADAAASTAEVVNEGAGGLDTMGDFMTTANTEFLPNAPSALIGGIALTDSLNKGDYAGAGLNGLDLGGMMTTEFANAKAQLYGRAGKVFKGGAWRWAKNMAGKAGRFAPAPNAAAVAKWQRIAGYGTKASGLAARWAVPSAIAGVFKGHSDYLKEQDSIARHNRFAIYTGGKLQNDPYLEKGTAALLNWLSGEVMWMPPETLTIGPDAYTPMDPKYYSDSKYWFCGPGGTPPREYGMGPGKVVK